MITRAYLVGRGETTGHESIGGISIALRQALSLQDAGVTELILVGTPASILRADSRLRLSIHDDHDPNVHADRAAIVAPLDLVWHPQVVRRLLGRVIAPDVIVAEGSTAAALYACGAARVAGVVRAIATSTNVGASEMNRPHKPEFVIAVRTSSDRWAATTLLLRSLQKPSDGVAARYVHRRISIAITRQLLPRAITPNQMTIAAALVGVAGVVLAARGGYWNLLGGAALFEAQNILDGCDGEIARLKYLRSRYGEWLDQIIDDVLNVVFMAAVGAGLAKDGFLFARPLMVAGVSAELVHTAAVYAGLLFKAGGRGSIASLSWWVGRAGRPLQDEQHFRIAAGDLTRRDFIAFAYVILAAFHLIAVAFVWQAVVSIGSAAVTVLQWIVWGGPRFYSGDETTAGVSTGDAPEVAGSRSAR